MSALLSEILDPSLVVLELREGTSAEAILEIAELFRNQGHVQDYYKFADAVMEREGRSSTNTGEGVAFPHARTDLVERITLGIGRTKAGIQFGLVKELVHLVFLFAVPKKNGDGLPRLRRRGRSRSERQSESRCAHGRYDSQGVRGTHPCRSAPGGVKGNCGLLRVCDYPCLFTAISLTDEFVPGRGLGVPRGSSS